MKLVTPLLAVALFASTTPAFGEETTPLPSTTEAAADQPAQKDEARAVRFGALAGVGFPRPLSVEGLVAFGKVASVGLEYGVLPTMTIANVEVGSKAITADARVFPFRGAFFIGLRAGRQTVDASSQVSAYGFTATESLSLESWFVNPRVGFLWTFEPGLALAMEAGVQIPVSSHTTSSLPTGLAVDQTVTNTATQLGKTVLPTVDLLRIGVVL